MQQFNIQVEDTVGEFYEEMAVVLGRPCCEVMSDVLFKNAETLRATIVSNLTVNLD